MRAARGANGPLRSGAPGRLWKPTGAGDVVPPHLDQELAGLLMDHWKVTETGDSVVVTCRGHDKSGTYVAAVAKFEACVARHPEAFRVIADLREMTGYETGARQAWQESFRKNRRLIRVLVFVGAKSTGIRMGAAVAGAVAGVPVRFVDGWSQIDD